MKKAIILLLILYISLIINPDINNIYGLCILLCISLLYLIIPVKYKYTMNKTISFTNSFAIAFIGSIYGYIINYDYIIFISIVSAFVFYFINNIYFIKKDNYQIGIEYYNNEKYEKAYQMFEEYINEENNEVINTSNKIEEKLLKIKNTESNINSSYYYLGKISYYKMGDYIKSVEYLNKAIKTNPYDNKSRFTLAAIYKENNDIQSFYEVTIKSYDYIYKINDLQTYYRNLGFYYYKTQKTYISNTLYSYSLVLNEETEESEKLKKILIKNNIPIYIKKSIINSVKQVYNKNKEDELISNIYLEYKKVI